MGEPFEPSSIDLVAAALRADASDVNLMLSALVTKVSGILPAAMLRVTNQRTISDRVAGRPGMPTHIVMKFEDRVAEMELEGALGVKFHVNQVVRGVVISRREVSPQKFFEIVAEELVNLAAHSHAARDALDRMIQ